MSQEIKVDMEVIQTELARLKTAMDTFEPFTKKYTKELSAEFDNFNSDFIKQFQALLENMSDSTGPKLMKQLQYFHQNTEKVIETLKITDEQLGG